MQAAGVTWRGLKHNLRMGWANGGRTEDPFNVPAGEKEGKISERNMNSQQKGDVYKS